jgi:hypothetical protein
LIGRWDLASYYLRCLFPILFLAAAGWSYRRTRTTPFFVDARPPRQRGAAAHLFAAGFLAAFVAWAVAGYFYRDTPVVLRFPLAGGWYYVAQGGSSSIVNQHNAVRPQQYALDIVALNAWGARARGLYPVPLDRYVIYGATVFSPCAGTVGELRDGLPDQVPPARDRENVAGNHMVITCQGVEVVLAHLLPDSIIVAPGQAVASGQPLGRVGNSGNTTEPHLHVHAVREGTGGPLKGDGVPILFEGRFAVRNATF